MPMIVPYQNDVQSDGNNGNTDDRITEDSNFKFEVVRPEDINSNGARPWQNPSEEGEIEDLANDSEYPAFAKKQEPFKQDDYMIMINQSTHANQTFLKIKEDYFDQLQAHKFA